MKLAHRLDGPEDAPLARALELARDDDARSGSRRSTRSPPASACCATTIRATATRRCPTGPFSVERARERGARAPRRARVERFSFCGLSLGGLVGMWLARDAPERLETARRSAAPAPSSARPEDWVERAALVRAEGMGALADRLRGAGSRRLPRQAVRSASGMTLLTIAAGGLRPLLRGDRRLRLPRRARRDRGADARDRRRGGSDDAARAGRGAERGDPETRDRRRPACGAPGERRATRGRASSEPSRAAGASDDGRVSQLIDERRDVRARACGSGARCSATSTSTARSSARPTSRADFQDFITRYAWGEIWARPGLDRQDAQLHHADRARRARPLRRARLHIRAARRNGLTLDEIKEVLLQTAVYCGVPAANSAFAVFQEVAGSGDAK